MEFRQIKGVIALALGAYTLLAALGVAKVSKNPETNAKFIRKWKWPLLVVTAFLLAQGITYVAKLYW